MTTDLPKKCLDTNVPITENMVLETIPSPDAEPEQGGALAFLQTKGIGPADELTLEPAKRLTIITGDNGLGKTFLLDCAWWALTGLWADRQALPWSNKQALKAEITFRIGGEGRASEGNATLSFDWASLSWPRPKKRPIIPGLIVYARVDGSFAVWDPARPANSADAKSVYTGAEVWDGLQGRIEGLIRDWVLWQSNPEKHPYQTFISVLEALSPPDLGPMKPGEPIRIPEDRREIPTIEHRYGTIPIVQASAGVRRIITLAYLIVWAWNEHRIAAGHRRLEPQKRIVILVDEMEAHLHPRWQRMILPALLRVGGMLPLAPEIQFLVATHSPLVMASAETVFDDEIDSLVHFSLDEKSGRVALEDTDFIRFGEASSWLTSSIFGLKHARSREAEFAMEEAKTLQKQDHPSNAEVAVVSERLVRYLAEDDRFWPRWIAFAERYGVEL
uniref:AAA domain-containing protein, putative AbiEii toxin, Type IV TA system n=1 Tax=Candidatus Kentrum sp. MB TaxID=2138164 RepID=A0A450XPF8_9GAMM|nr:MAG: AAA domain-containing protein, putative AbiEii toxin, Type IV TA system [Candidatus Kentron sp. MB]VFK31191.1 MAG: AAA domain-containing protein, putative AbiEii toxin, Type IV TA system [Candidatus Kentron sp. MB]VFK75384.1 MAG: AAA domain-containing protein, putative AbiEii toxin, Type IV TA system [Candidatus Kentron sp. MB]